MCMRDIPLNPLRDLPSRWLSFPLCTFRPGTTVGHPLPRGYPPSLRNGKLRSLQAKPLFNAHHVLRQARACVRHARQQSTERDSHAGNSNVSHGRKPHPTKPHGAAMCGTML